MPLAVRQCGLPEAQPKLLDIEIPGGGQVVVGPTASHSGWRTGSCGAELLRPPGHPGWKCGPLHRALSGGSASPGPAPNSAGRLRLLTSGEAGDQENYQS